MRVTDANGVDLGAAYAFQVLPVVRAQAGAGYVQVPVSAAGQSQVLLAEQPLGPGTPRYLVWRFVGTNGSTYAFPMDCWFGGPVNGLNAASIYYTGTACTGTAYVESNQIPGPGFACSSYVATDANQPHLVTSASTVTPGVVLIWSAFNEGNCSTHSSQMAFTSMYALTDLGPVRLYPAPLRLVPQ